MDEYISRKAAIAYIREQSEECQKAFEELGGESGIYADAYNDLAEDFYSIPAADVAPEGWISVKDKLPEPETEVLAVCVRDGYRFICPVIFEDGTMLTQNSMWNWYELENYGLYSEENDDYFIPEGWWENRQFTPDDIYNNPVDCTVTHWMPLPEPPMSAIMDGESNGKAD
nr:MAG TPA: Protein of unknown function (DUF551) [Caudoviricetes sp.]